MKQPKEKNKRETLTILRRLFAYWIQEKRRLFVAILLIFLSTACSVAGSYLLRPIINTAIIPKDLSRLSHLLLILGGIYLVGAFAVWAQYRILNVVGQRTIAKIREELFTKMEKLPLHFFDTNQHGELMSRYTNDMDRVGEVLAETLTDMFTNILSLLAVFCMMIFISPLLTLTTVIILPLMLLAARAVVRKSKYYFKEQQAALGRTNGYIEEIITGQKVVKIFCHEQAAEEDFNRFNEELEQKAERAQFFSGIMMPLMQNMNTINFVLVSIVGAILAIFRGFDLGGLAAFLQYSRQFGRPINELSAQYNTLQSAIAGAERIFNLMDIMPEDIEDVKVPLLKDVRLKGNITFREVSFSYLPDVPVLKSISFQAAPGKKIALVGETGVGKTTIFNILPRFYEIQSGEILIDDVPITQIDRDTLRRSIAIVLQETHLFNDTVMENIRYGKPDATDEEVKSAAKLAAADSFISQLPQSYETQLTDDGANLSQGQRQLLNIARAIVADLPILLLDEATSDVDSHTEKLIQQGMDTLMQGRTCIVIAHRLSTIQNADEILVLSQGEIVERGSHQALLKQKDK